jgi:hypothetical protein
VRNEFPFEPGAAGAEGVIEHAIHSRAHRRSRAT